MKASLLAQVLEQYKAFCSLSRHDKMTHVACYCFVSRLWSPPLFGCRACTIANHGLAPAYVRSYLSIGCGTGVILPSSDGSLQGIARLPRRDFVKSQRSASAPGMIQDCSGPYSG